MSDSIVVSTPLAAASPARYVPSWVDRVTRRIDRLPFPAWVFYLALAILLTGLEAASLFLDDTYPGRVLAWHFVLSTTGVYFLALTHWLDRAAVRALAAFRPALKADDGNYDILAYELTTLPARPALVFSAAWCGMSMLMLLSTPAATFRDVASFTSPLTSAVQSALWVFTWWTGGAMIYHTIHQLSVISRILGREARVDLFALRPLYAFAPLTAVTSVGYVLTAYAWLSSASAGVNSSNISILVGVLVSNLGLVIATFVWPLWGVHRLLVAEKARWQADVAARTKATILDLQRGPDEVGRPGAAHLKDTLDALVVAEATLDRIRTWPWQPGTARGLTGAVVLPILIWLITRLLERFAGF